MARHPEHVKELEGKTLTCRGPAILTEDRRRRELASVYGAAEAGDIAGVEELAEGVRRELAGICKAHGWPPPAPARAGFDPVEEAIRIVGAHTEACGQVLNGVVLDAGADGEEHSAACPRCGNVFSWRAPRFD